jgi:predicted dehydrogenase
LGNIGTSHANYLREGKIDRCTLTAVCDVDPKRLEAFGDYKQFSDSAEMIRSGEVDAVIVGTPHYDHTTIGIDAMENGVHVLVEKPISVHKADAEKLIAAYEKSDVKFSAMFQMRTYAMYQRIKQLIDSGELGAIQRVNWIVSAWFRTEAYYSSGGWRATWAGEGGGVLMNQCPHNLDLFQWFFGMPKRVTAFCGWGKYHNIEVEDEVTAYMDFENGATGVFIASTGEAPGTDRLEIAGDRGKLLLEDGALTFTRNVTPTQEFNQTHPGAFDRPDVWNVEIPVDEGEQGHFVVTQNFVNAILDDTPLIAPAQDGIRSVELANAMLLSAFTESPVDVPLDGEQYWQELKKRIDSSTFKKEVIETVVEDMEKSFH